MVKSFRQCKIVNTTGSDDVYDPCRLKVNLNNKIYHCNNKDLQSLYHCNNKKNLLLLWTSHKEFGQSPKKAYQPDVQQCVADMALQQHKFFSMEP